jgi:hypothetical protein
MLSQLASPVHRCGRETHRRDVTLPGADLIGDTGERNRVTRRSSGAV